MRSGPVYAARMSNQPPADPLDGYRPTLDGPDRATDPARDPVALAAVEDQARLDAAELFGRADAAMVEGNARMIADGFRNLLTGIGDPTRDKTLGTDFLVRYVTGAECEDRWRGSDLGGRIIETIPNEMTRRGWTLNVQPDEDDGLARRSDDWPAPEPASPPHVPGALPETSDDGTAIVEALDKKLRKLKATQAIRQALEYERAFGGGAVLIGVDDGEDDLTRPLDPTTVKRVRHLTAYRGGWDGELIAWRYYNDPRHPKFGEPEIYMLRNLGVPISSPPAPGERLRPQAIPAGPTGALIFYVHESRLLLFPGQPVSRRARVQMRGWGDSVFTRVDEVLSQFGQTWSGVSILMQEYSLPVMSMEGLAALLAKQDTKGQAVVGARVIAMQMAMSIAKMRLIDSKEKLERLSVPLAGVGEVLSQFALRLAAASGMPVSMLMGQVQGGLGDASKGDVRFFYDQIEGLQEDRLLPEVERLYKVLFLAGDSPTSGVEPKRWSVTMNPIWQMTDQERATYRKTIAETDQIYVNMGGASPEEVVATRFGGSDYNDGPIVIDVEGRQKMADLDAKKAEARALAAKAQLAAGAQPTAPGAPPPAADPSKKLPGGEGAPTVPAAPPPPAGGST